MLQRQDDVKINNPISSAHGQSRGPNLPLKGRSHWDKIKTLDCALRALVNSSWHWYPLEATYKVRRLFLSELGYLLERYDRIHHNKFSYRSGRTEGERRFKVGAIVNIW